jgi:hypothetical protein
MDSAKVRLRNPEHYDASENLVVPPDLLSWIEVPYLLPLQCEHVETMCRECQESWELDYEVLLDDPT